MALLKGTLDVLVLKTLSWGPMHGAEITSWLKERPGGRLHMTDAALLQALHRREERDYLSAAWAMTRNGRKVHYDRLTPAGRAHLRTESTALVDHVQVLTAIQPSVRDISTNAMRGLGTDINQAVSPRLFLLVSSAASHALPSCWHCSGFMA